MFVSIIIVSICNTTRLISEKAKQKGENNLDGNLDLTRSYRFQNCGFDISLFLEHKAQINGKQWMVSYCCWLGAKNIQKAYDIFILEQIVKIL